MFFRNITNKSLFLVFFLVGYQIVENLADSNGKGPNEKETTPGATLLHEGKFKEAAEKYRISYLSSHKKTHSDLSEAAKIASVGMEYLTDGKFAESSTIFQEAFDTSQSDDVTALVHAGTALAGVVFTNCRDASLLAIRGLIFLKQGNFNEAIDVFRKASKKIETMTAIKSTFDNCINAITIASVGKSLLVAGNFKESTEIFQRAYEKSQVDSVSLALLNLKIQSGFAWEGLSSIIQLQCFDNASKSFQNAYEKSTIRGFYYTFAHYRDAANMAKQGSDFMKLGKFSDALKEFQDAINIFHINTFSSYINATQSAIKGHDMLKEGKPFEASVHFQNALLMRNNIFAGDVHVLVNCRDASSVAAEGQTLMTRRKFHEALLKFQEAFDKSEVREVKYLLSRFKKLPYEGGSYCSHDDFAAVEPN